MTGDFSAHPERATDLCSRRALLAAGLAAGVLATTPVDAAAKASSSRPLVRVRLRADGADQSRALQAAIDGAPDGAVVVLPAGRFRLDRRIQIAGRQNLTIRPPVHQRFTSYTNMTGFDVGDLSRDGAYSYRSHWQVTRSSNVKLRRIDVEGPNQFRSGNFTEYVERLAFEHAFAVVGGSTNITIKDCSFASVHGDGYYVGGVGDPCRDITIVDCTGTFCGRQSMGITNVDGLLVSDVRISGGGRSGVDIEPNHQSHFVRNVTLRRVDMGSRFYPFVVGGSVDVIRRENIVLDSCTAHLSSSSHPALLASRNGRNISVVNHTDVRQGSKYGMIFAGWDGVIVTGAQVSSGRHTPATAGVLLRDCSGPIVLKNNHFIGSVEGFDELVATEGDCSSAQVESSGNFWAMGTRSN